MIDYEKPDDDRVVAEVRQAPEAYSARLNDDLEVLFATAKAGEQSSNRSYLVPSATVVTPTPDELIAGVRQSG